MFIVFYYFINKNNCPSKKFTKLHFKLFEKYKNISDDKLSDIPIYYINLNRSNERKDHIEKQLKQYNIKNYQRIEAIDSNNININTGKIYLDSNTDIEYKNYYTVETINELACTLSHLKAIYNAYKNGDDIALICEDDVSFGLYPLWRKDLKNILNNDIPKNWNALNLSSYYYGIKNLHNSKHKKKYIKYYNFPLQAYAYLINREGMKNILYDILQKNKIDLGSNILTDGNSLLADKLIFHRAKNTYIYTDDALFYPYNNYNEMNSTINTNYINIHINTYLKVLKNKI